MSGTEVFEKWESEIRGYCRAYPTVFKSASNARQIDEDGKSYIDFFAGAGVLNFGHNNEHMKRALVDYIQSDGVAHSLDLYTTAKRDFVQAFAETILEPRGMDYKMQFMGPTGTNAVEVALKLARRVTGRRQVVAFTHGFHGMTLGSLAATANAYFRNASGVPLEYVTHRPFGCEETCMGCRLGCGLASIEQLRALYEDSSSGVEAPAAFLVETIQAEGGVRVASTEWLQALRKLARDVGALYIIDDIQVGCGRTGRYFSFEEMDLDPDVVTLAKGIGGFGTPLAMNLVKPEHDAHWQPGEHTGTFRGQGLSFVAGAEGLRYFRDDAFLEDVRRKGARVGEHLEGLRSALPGVPMQIRGKGMLYGVELGDGARAKEIARRAFEEGLLVSTCGTGGSVLKVIPPLTIPDEDLQAGLEILSKAVTETGAGAR